MSDLINAANIVYSEYTNLIDQKGINTFTHYAFNLLVITAFITLLWSFGIFMDKTFAERFWIFIKSFFISYISFMWCTPLIDSQHIKMACLPIFLLAEYGVLRLMLYLIKDHYNQVVDIKYIKYETVDIKYIRKHGGDL